MSEEKQNTSAPTTPAPDAQEIAKIPVHTDDSSEEISFEEISKTEALIEEGEGDVKGIDVAAWNPKTTIGKKVKSGEITRFDQILNAGLRNLEVEVVDYLIPNLEVDLLMIGQSKGKFGGGARRVFKQVQKKTAEGNKPHFATMAVAGNKDGFVGLGYGKAKDTVPAREKAIRQAKLNIIMISRGCGSWQCGCKEPHTIPFKITGKCGSVIITLIPAPKGTGLKAGKEVAKMLALAGISDVWSQTSGQTKVTVNLAKACFAALKQLIATRVKPSYHTDFGIIEGPANKNVHIKQAEVPAMTASEQLVVEESK